MHVLYTYEHVEKFILSLEQKSQAAVREAIDVLREFGYELRMPDSRPIMKGILELRIRGAQEVRLIYTFKGGAIYIFYGFIKKSEQIPRHELHHIKRLFASL